MLNAIEESVHISNNYQLALGESLHLPNVLLDWQNFRQIENFVLYKICSSSNESHESDNDIIIEDYTKDCLIFENGGSVIKVSPTDPGRYVLKIRPNIMTHIARSYYITVNDCRRWSSNNNYLEKRFSL